MAELVIIGILLLLVVAGFIGLLNSEDRYSKMTEEEFEAEAKRSSAIGAAVMGMQEILEPSRKVEYIRQEKTEAERADAGDKSTGGTPTKP
ncbi:MAG: hypothetical protein HY046_01550 [Acidobacteria bacterium]|nr:hypothetical protein [Acidobacteriota bacterium]